MRLRFSPGVAAIILLTLGQIGCAHHHSTPKRQLWIPVQSQGHYDLEGRELWIDVELSGYTRQTLERYSDYEAQQDDPPPSQQSSVPEESEQD